MSSPCVSESIHQPQRDKHLARPARTSVVGNNTVGHQLSLAAPEKPQKSPSSKTTGQADSPVLSIMLDRHAAPTRQSAEAVQLCTARTKMPVVR